MFRCIVPVDRTKANSHETAYEGEDELQEVDRHENAHQVSTQPVSEVGYSNWKMKNTLVFRTNKEY